MNRVCGHYTLLVPAANKLSASMHVPKCVPHFAASCSMPLLKVRLEFLELLLAGDKVWELRSSPVQRRGRVALGIGGVAYGSAVLCDSIFVGVKKPGSAWVPPDDNSDNFWLSAENMSKHRVSEDELTSLMKKKAKAAPEVQKLWAWVFKDAMKFKKPLPYTPDGSVRWTTLQAGFKMCVPFTRAFL